MFNINSNSQFKHASSYYDDIFKYLNSITTDINWSYILCKHKDWNDSKIYKYIYDLLNVHCSNPYIHKIQYPSNYVNIIKLYNKLSILNNMIVPNMVILNTSTNLHNTIISQIYKCDKLYKTRMCDDIGIFVKSPFNNYFDVVIVEDEDITKYIKLVKYGGIIISINKSIIDNNDYLYHDIIRRINHHCLMNDNKIDNELPEMPVQQYIRNKDIRDVATSSNYILFTDQIYNMHYISIFVNGNS